MVSPWVHENKITWDSFEDYFKRARQPNADSLPPPGASQKYAYEMTQELKERTGASTTCRYSIRCSTGFRIRDSSEESEKVISQNNRVRNYYRLTPAGIAHLEVMRRDFVRLCRHVLHLTDLPGDRP